MGKPSQLCDSEVVVLKPCRTTQIKHTYCIRFQIRSVLSAQRQRTPNSVIVIIDVSVTNRRQLIIRRMLTFQREGMTKSTTNNAYMCLGWVKISRPTRTKEVISETFTKPISWLGMEKPNPAEEKHAFTKQRKCTTTQNKH